MQSCRSRLARERTRPSGLVRGQARSYRGGNGLLRHPPEGEGGDTANGQVAQQHMSNADNQGVARYGVIFPGQGSQSPGMLATLADEYAVVRETFGQASESLGYDLWALVQNDTGEQLNQTEFTQPALLAAGVATWRAWNSVLDVQPACVAGHSLGEYSALVAANVLDFEQAIRIVAERGRLMQAAVPVGEGAMAAILGLDDATVASVCEEAAEAGPVSSANLNAPGQVVIAGTKTAVDRAIELAKAAGARRALPLAVSVPSHCSLMESAAKELARQLAQVTVSAPNFPVIQNVDAASHTDADAIRVALASQLTHPVRWVETVQKMAADGVTALVECGPGKVLTGLVKRIDKTLPTYPVIDPATLVAAMEGINVS